jgi:hypothetical protein
MKLKLDEYDIKAKAIPSFFSTLPILIIVYFYLYPKMKGFVDFVMAIEILGLLSSGAIFTFAFMELCRLIGVQYEDIYFKDGLHMPTTDLLLYSNSTYSSSYKDRIRAKIKQDFGMELPNEVEELENERSARQAIKEAVSPVRKKVKKGYLTHHKNIQYGFWRNLVGASTLGLLFSVVSIILFRKIVHCDALTISIVLAVIYLLTLLFSRPVLKKLGHIYAKTLFEEYMSPDIV